MVTVPGVEGIGATQRRGEISNRINCLKNDPTLPSVLNFLRKTPWARAKVEELYRNSKFRTTD
jgi:uncharacterized protein (DUF2132 family)